VGPNVTERWNDVIILRGKNWKERHTDVIPTVCTVFINELGVYVVPIGGFVVEKTILGLPAGKVVEALDDSYIGTVVRSVGGFVDTVDAAIEIFGQVAQNLDFDAWKARLKGTREHVAARTNWSWISLNVVEGDKLWNEAYHLHPMRCAGSCFLSRRIDKFQAWIEFRWRLAT